MEDLEALAGNHFCTTKNDVCDDFNDCLINRCIYKKAEQENPYWQNIEAIAKRQREKGISTYGVGIENNTWEIEKRIEYLEEELVDGLMYCEWIKDGLKKRGGGA